MDDGRVEGDCHFNHVEIIRHHPQVHQVKHTHVHVIRHWHIVLTVQGHNLSHSCRLTENLHLVEQKSEMQEYYCSASKWNR